MADYFSDGVIDDTQTMTMSAWVHNRNAVQTLTNDLWRMSGDSDSVLMTHNEEVNYRMLQDAEDRCSIRIHMKLALYSIFQQNKLSNHGLSQPRAALEQFETPCIQWSIDSP